MSIWRQFAKGTRVRLTSDIKWRCPIEQIASRQRDGEPTEKIIVPRGTTGTVVWIGRDRKQPAKLGLIRVGVRFDGEDKARFFGAGIIVRCDGLTSGDIAARRKTPRRQFAYQELRNIRAGTRTFGTDAMTEEQREELRRIAAEFPEAGYLVHELRPGYDKPIPDEMDALREARRLAPIGRSQPGVVIKTRDGHLFMDDGRASSIHEAIEAVTA